MFIVEQIRRLLAWDERDSERGGETAIGGPFHEVADAAATLGVVLVEPAVDVVLAQFLQHDLLFVEPGEQFQGDQDAAAQIPADRDRVATYGCAVAGSPQEEPMQERADEVRVRDWACR